MSEQRDFDRFVKGEIRVDGWKSEWRKDFEAYREDKPAPRVMAPAVIKNVVRQSNNRPGKKPCPLCARPMKRNQLGICCPCGRKWRRFIDQTSVRVCAAPGCFICIQGNAKYGLCVTHSHCLRSKYSLANKLRKAA
jgi:hypothetical protein